MKIFHIFFGVIFILFAALQYNDPDPLVWMAVYLGSAFLCFLSIFKQKSHFFRKFYLIWAIFTAIFGIFQWPPIWEGLGLFICSFIAILQYIIIIRKSISQEIKP